VVNSLSGEACMLYRRVRIYCRPIRSLMAYPILHIYVSRKSREGRVCILM